MHEVVTFTASGSASRALHGGMKKSGERRKAGLELLILVRSIGRAGPLARRAYEKASESFRGSPRARWSDLPPHPCNLRTTLGSWARDPQPALGLHGALGRLNVSLGLHEESTELDVSLGNLVSDEEKPILEMLAVISSRHSPVLGEQDGGCVAWYVHAD